MVAFEAFSRHDLEALFSRGRADVDLERAERAAAPVQERFGPSLPQLIAPRIDRLPAIARRVGGRDRAGGRRGDHRRWCCATATRCSPGRAAGAFTHELPALADARADAARRARCCSSSATPAGSVASFEVTPLRLPRYAGEISGLLAGDRAQRHPRRSRAAGTARPTATGATGARGSSTPRRSRSRTADSSTASRTSAASCVITPHSPATGRPAALDADPLLGDAEGGDRRLDHPRPTGGDGRACCSTRSQRLRFR